MGSDVHECVAALTLHVPMVVDIALLLPGWPSCSGIGSFEHSRNNSSGLGNKKVLPSSAALPGGMLLLVAVVAATELSGSAADEAAEAVGAS